MKPFTKEYLAFENRHLKELYALWYTTYNEDLRKILLDARAVLECIFDGADQVSTARDNGDGNSTQQVVKTKQK